MPHNIQVLSSSHSCRSNSDKVTELSLRKHFYPSGFEQELQTNLDFFLDGVGVDEQAKVPFDTLLVTGSDIDPQYYVNTTEIGLYLNILTEAYLNGHQAALVRINQTLDVLFGAPTWNGLFYWPYDIVEGQLKPQEEGIVPAVDNANLAFALTAVSGAFFDSADALAVSAVKKIDDILQRQIPGWQQLYEPNRDLLYAGWSSKDSAPLGYYIDRKANESRLAPLWAHLITKGTTSPVPKSAFENMELYTSTCVLKGQKLRPMLTWDGAYFQGMLPAIWLNERCLIPDYSIIEDMTKVQQAHSEHCKIPFVSSAATTDDSYAAFGVPAISEAAVRFELQIAGGNTGTPHATALSFMVNPPDAIAHLQSIKQLHPDIESPYGWFDAVDTKGNMSSKLISLDQGMFVCSFLATSINQQVKMYLEQKGFYPDVVDMYKSFTPS
ncbi:membrane protein [Photobacterium gaetbulicola]|uniref:Membrane protein n=1 Tax=Photobacterium gaetbulicola TaxID=1295392 RepID=A0A0B9GC82_9GAMM|nr:membrane protein [Photobacterium gaetbulicola]